MAVSNLNDLISSSLDKVRALADSDTVIGEPITTQTGVTIIPVSKVSLGFVSGGVDSEKKNNQNESVSAKMNFCGGGGTGISVTPIAFLLVHPDGRVETQTLNAPSDTLDKVALLAEKTPSILERIVKIFKSDKKDKKSKAGEKESKESQSNL